MSDYSNFLNTERWKSFECYFSIKQLFQYRNIFQNVVNALSKIVDTFLSKNLNLIQFVLSDNVQILLACGTNTYKGITNDI